MPTDAWRVGVHVGVPHLAHVRKRARPAHLRRLQRNHEGTYRQEHRGQTIEVNEQFLQRVSSLVNFTRQATEEFPQSQT